MDEHDYIYQLRPLIIPGAIFLVIYPVVLVILHLLAKLPAVELGLLIGIYVLAALGIVFLWLTGNSKRVQINDRQIVFQSILGKNVLTPQDIRRVAFYFDGKGQEIVQIRTEEDLYYLSECYFPFPELMADLENFIQIHDLRSNLQSHASLAH